MAAMRGVLRHTVRLARPARRASTWMNRASSLGKPVRAILEDYVEVFKDLLKSSWKNPFKTILYVSTGSLIVASVGMRPDYSGYLNDVLEYANELSMCSDMVRSPRAKSYIDNIITMHSDGMLTCINLGVVSLIMRNTHSTHCSNFHETCSSLQPRLWKRAEFIMDIGVWGHWLLLDTNLKDYDINDEQLSNLPMTNQK